LYQSVINLFQTFIWQIVNNRPLTTTVKDSRTGRPGQAGHSSLLVLQRASGLQAPMAQTPGPKSGELPHLPESDDNAVKQRQLQASDEGGNSDVQADNSGNVSYGGTAVTEERVHSGKRSIPLLDVPPRLIFVASKEVREFVQSISQTINRVRQPGKRQSRPHEGILASLGKRGVEHRGLSLAVNRVHLSSEAGSPGAAAESRSKDRQNQDQFDLSGTHFPGARMKSRSLLQSVMGRHLPKPLHAKGNIGFAMGESTTLYPQFLKDREAGHSAQGELSDKNEGQPQGKKINSVARPFLATSSNNHHTGLLNAADQKLLKEKTTTWQNKKHAQATTGHRPADAVTAKSGHWGEDSNPPAAPDGRRGTPRHSEISPSAVFEQKPTSRPEEFTPSEKIPAAPARGAKSPMSPTSPSGDRFTNRSETTENRVLPQIHRHSSIRSTAHPAGGIKPFPKTSLPAMLLRKARTAEEETAAGSKKQGTTQGANAASIREAAPQDVSSPLTRTSFPEDRLRDGREIAENSVLRRSRQYKLTSTDRLAAEINAFPGNSLPMTLQRKAATARAEKDTNAAQKSGGIQNADTRLPHLTRLHAGIRDIRQNRFPVEVDTTTQRFDYEETGARAGGMSFGRPHARLEQREEQSFRQAGLKLIYKPAVAMSGQVPDRQGKPIKMELIPAERNSPGQTPLILQRGNGPVPTRTVNAERTEEKRESLFSRQQVQHAPQIDVQRLAGLVYEELERKIRIERERRGF
jgi:hypothetical protein